jgi:O-methyltransferase
MSSAPGAKYIRLNAELYDYIIRHRSRPVDPLLDPLRAETDALGEIARMLIRREQGDFLAIPDPDVIALDRLNKKLAADLRVESVLLPVADGLHLARKTWHDLHNTEEGRTRTKS